MGISTGWKEVTKPPRSLQVFLEGLLLLCRTLNPVWCETQKRRAHRYSWAEKFSHLLTRAREKDWGPRTALATALEIFTDLVFCEMLFGSPSLASGRQQLKTFLEVFFKSHLLGLGI